MSTQDQPAKPCYLAWAWREEQNDNAELWAIHVVGATDGADRTPVNCVSEAESRAEVHLIASDLIACWLDADLDTFDVTVRYLDPPDMAALREPHRSNVYVRIGEDGAERRIGTVTIDNPAGMTTAMVELFRAAALAVAAEGEEGQP